MKYQIEHGMTIENVVSFKYDKEKKTLFVKTLEERDDEKEKEDEKKKDASVSESVSESVSDQDFESDSETEYEKVSHNEESKETKKGYIYLHLKDEEKENMDQSTKEMLKKYEESVKNKDDFHKRIDHHVKIYFQYRKKEDDSTFKSFTLYQKVLFSVLKSKSKYNTNDDHDDKPYVSFIRELITCEIKNPVEHVENGFSLTRIFEEVKYDLEIEKYIYLTFSIILREIDTGFVFIPKFWENDGLFREYLSTIEEKNRIHLIKKGCDQIDIRDFRHFLSNLVGHGGFTKEYIGCNIVSELYLNDEQVMAKKVLRNLFDSYVCNVNLFCTILEEVKDKDVILMVRQIFKEHLQSRMDSDY